MTDLETLDAARQAVSLAHSIVEVNRLIKLAEVVRAVADTEEMQRKANELYVRARRKRGELWESEPNKRMPGGDHSIVRTSDNGPEPPAPRQRLSEDTKLAAIPEDLFEAVCRSEEVSISTALRVATGKPHVANNGGNNEWYTPPEYIAAALQVLGSIDLDPASTATGNEIVRAETYYTAEENGLEQEWMGTVWMNPPYAQPLISQFVDKLIESVFAKTVTSACVLVNNATETDWWQSLSRLSTMLCFPHGRIRFLDAEGNPGAPLQGQTIFYIGDYPEVFSEYFEQFGLIVRPERE